MMFFHSYVKYVTVNTCVVTKDLCIHAAFSKRACSKLCICLLARTCQKLVSTPPPAITDIGQLNMDESRYYDYNSNLYLFL